ncbi:TPA: BppU family phage baseplate upper protein [Bacillus pseudomycoides]|nr:BppU family phage baseplate upper protein [Bacillus pseudomycoides]
MKIKLILDVNKSENAQLNYIVTGRVGDVASNIVDVYIVDGGNPYPLTNLGVFYECTKPDNTVVRDSAGVKMIDAANGRFEYTFPKETFSAPGRIKRSFFAIEKDKVIRATTQDFTVVSLANALDGNVQSGTYISDLEKLIEQANGLIKHIKELEKQAGGLVDKELATIRNKVDAMLKEIKAAVDGLNPQITVIQNKINDLNKQITTMDVLKKTGDMMTGYLTMRPKPDSSIGIGFKTEDAVLDTGLVGVANGQLYLKDWKNNKILFDKTIDGTFNVFADNLLKKIGDTMAGDIQLDRVNSTNARYVQYKLGSAFEYSAGVNKQGKYHLYEHTHSSTVFEYDPSTKTFTLLGNTNLLKKTGDTMTGPLKVKIDASNVSPIVAETLDGSIRLLPWSTANYIQSGTLDGEAKDLIISGNSAKKINKVQVIAKEFIVEGVIKQSNDTDWVNLTLINGATVDAGRTPRYKCHNNVVYIVGAVANIKDSMTIANIPSGLRPPSDCAFAITYIGDGDKKYIGELNARADGRITTDWLWNTPKSTAFCISYHL